MMASHWCMLGVTGLLLVSEITISQLCKSLIIMVDGFHTLYTFMHMVLPLPWTQSLISSPQFSSVGACSHPHPPAAEHKLSSQIIPPAAPNCGLSFPRSRIQVVGVFISALLLVSLCISYFLEIINHILDPHPVQLPLLPVMVAAVSLLLKMRLFFLNWDQLQDGTCNRTETESHLQINPQAVAAGEDFQDREEADNVVQLTARSASDDCLHSGDLVLCNPGTSSVSDPNCKNQQKQLDVLDAAADLKSESCKHPDDRNTSKTSLVCRSSPVAETTSGCVSLLSSVLIVQGLFTSLLALINSLVTLLIVPQLLQSSAACRVLVYLDPGLSMLAVITLIATTVPQVYRCAHMLLQAVPPHASVSELRRRIASVPGVHGVHDLHVWQLTEFLTVASVHVHCCPGFPVHRCDDLKAGITKELQSVGVSCCTVQPEFTSSSGVSDSAFITCRQEPSSAPLPSCSLACQKACAAKMCCSLLEDETLSVSRPPAVEIKEDPQMVIENTFL